MLDLAIKRPIHLVCAALSMKSRIDSSVLKKYASEHKRGYYRGFCIALDSHLEFTDVLQQRLRRVFPLSLHAPSECREQMSCSVRETETFLLICFDILSKHV